MIFDGCACALDGVKIVRYQQTKTHKMILGVGYE